MLEEVQIRAMIAAAHEARDRAYAPYSKFKVGAAALGQSGKVYTGCNVENASYGLTVCAERVAIWKAVSEGENHISAIAVVTGDEMARPCGACLQVMAEFERIDGHLQIVTVADDGRHEIRMLGEYLPMRFALEGRR